MGKIDNHVATMLYLHPAVRSWVEQRASFETTSISGVVRKAIRDFIQQEDPEGWAEIETTLRADAAPADGDQEDNEAAADGS